MNRLTSVEIIGNWNTLLLATDKDGRIDYSKMSDEIDTLIASKPNGIYSNGTAGEFYAQSRQEFVDISLMLSEKCEKSGVPYQIGVSHPCAQTSLERLLDIKQLRPGAVQVILPDWFPVSTQEAISFLSVMEQSADGINMVLYNPPHAKKVLQPSQWQILKKHIPSLVGVKVFDNGISPEWYKLMNESKSGLSVFIPGHHLASGIGMGADGAYSNVACLNPFAAQRWYEMTQTDMSSAMEMEGRIQKFMSSCITPFITKYNYPNHACDRFMAAVGGWSDVGLNLRWPYRSIPEPEVLRIREAAKNIIPEFIR